MAESDYTVITTVRRENLCKITSGAVSTIPPITHVAFGSGGVDPDGAVLSPSPGQTALVRELGRYPIDKVEYPVGTTARYTVAIPAQDLVGAQISEAALVDGAGTLCAIRNMLSKGKDEGVGFTFTFDDEF